LKYRRFKYAAILLIIAVTQKFDALRQY